MVLHLVGKVEQAALTMELHVNRVFVVSVARRQPKIHFACQGSVFLQLLVRNQVIAKSLLVHKMVLVVQETMVIVREGYAVTQFELTIIVSVIVLLAHVEVENVALLLLVAKKDVMIKGKIVWSLHLCVDLVDAQVFLAHYEELAVIKLRDLVKYQLV